MPPTFLIRVKCSEKIGWVRQIVNRAYGVPPHVSHMPVDHPVSLDRRNLQVLGTEPYVATFKADGTRYLLVLCMYRLRPLACFVDRVGAVYSLHVRAPAVHFHKGSVFDGELCACLTGEHTYDYLVFNALIDQGAELRRLPYHTRLDHVRRNFAADPMTTAERGRFQAVVLATWAGLHLRYKETDSAQNLRSMQRSVVPRYRCDGFVFTAADAPTTPGRDERMLKYKTDNPIDVRLVVSPDGWREVFIDNTGQHMDLAELIPYTLHNDEQFQLIVTGAQAYNRALRTGSAGFDHVIEVDCRIQQTPGQGEALELRFLRIRTDKDGANNVTTVARTLQSIRDNIALEEVFDVVGRVTATGPRCS
jgi:hypothetical protein